MIDAEHHQTQAIEAILKHISRAENLQYDLAIFRSTSNRPTELADVLLIPAPYR
jgi:hypothetical protein